MLYYPSLFLSLSLLVLISEPLICRRKIVIFFTIFYIISLRFIILISLRSIISHKLCIEGSGIYFYHIYSLHLMMLLLFELKFILDWWLESEVLRYFMSLKFLLLIQMLRLWHRLFLLFFMSSCYECCPWQFHWQYLSQ